MVADAERGFVSIVTAPAGAKVYNPDGKSEPDACDLAPQGHRAPRAPPWVR
ncbi:hypothetical protein GCM10020001_042340 [Nonomuraea salmonea]